MTATSSHLPATPGQLRKIKALGGGPAAKRTTIAQARWLIHDLTERKRYGLCSPRQEWVLTRHGMADGPVKRHFAKAMTDYLAAVNWSHSGPIDRGRMAIRSVQDGYMLAIDGHAVGRVFDTAEEVRSAYQ